MTDTFACLYCGYPYPTEQSTLEHAIPQSLGGALAPDRFKLHNVCKKCNNDLGAYVDASFAKSWFVTNGLATAAHKLYASVDDAPLPLTCMGPIDFADLAVPEGCLAELWLGPSGESMFWLRPKDEMLYWYSGGNPRHRAEPSTVYWFPTSADPTRLKIGSDSLFSAFKKRKNARKVMGVACHGFPGNGYPPGFDVPDGTDMANVVAIQAQMEGFHCRVPFNLQFDTRFICKLALGVGYSLFGDAFASTENAKELRKGCWPKNQTQIGVRGVPMFGSKDPVLERFMGYPGAVVLVVTSTIDGFVLMMTIDEGKPFIVGLAPASLCSSAVTPEGYALLLFPSIRRCVEMTFVELVGHHDRSWPHRSLAEIDVQLARSAKFWSTLARLPTRSSES
ncbi:MAG: HNH endonuclease [Rhodanobacteraceae bacterium]|nr:MAG: HNH endonuclease [Rhodanobacteraceae bacterium]